MKRLILGIVVGAALGAAGVNAAKRPPAAERLDAFCAKMDARKEPLPSGYYEAMVNRAAARGAQDTALGRAVSGLADERMYETLCQ